MNEEWFIETTVPDNVINITAEFFKTHTDDSLHIWDGKFWGILSDWFTEQTIILAICIPQILTVYAKDMGCVAIIFYIT